MYVCVCMYVRTSNIFLDGGKSAHQSLNRAVIKFAIVFPRESPADWEFILDILLHYYLLLYSIEFTFMQLLVEIICL